MGHGKRVEKYYYVEWSAPIPRDSGRKNQNKEST